MKTTEIKKEILKNKLTARFSHYVSGNLYYTVELESGLYQFPISVVDRDSNQMSLSADLGTTTFDAEVKASLLNRWIGKAIEKEEFIKIQESYERV